MASGEVGSKRWKRRLAIKVFFLAAAGKIFADLVVIPVLLSLGASQRIADVIGRDWLGWLAMWGPWIYSGTGIATCLVTALFGWLAFADLVREYENSPSTTIYLALVGVALVLFG